jgi:hypothetical protein
MATGEEAGGGWGVIVVENIDNKNTIKFKNRGPLPIFWQFQVTPSK